MTMLAPSSEQARCTCSTAGCCRRSSPRYLSGKKGYGERIGLACGLLLSFIAILIWLVIPSKPTSDWGRRKAARKSGDA